MTTTPTTKAEAALAYASWGWRVLPVVPNGKVPATQHGVKDATTDPGQIARWWAQNPDYNIGIAAGAASGIVVFDVDPRNGGDESWRKWVDENGAAPDGAMQMTAGGGAHYLAAHQPEIRSCKLLDGIDLLADGRYFVAYPSTIEGRSYQWEASSDPFDGVAPALIPPAWLAAYQAKRRPEARGFGGAVPDGGIITGNRNNALAALGGSMRRLGMCEAAIFAGLSATNETRCEIPLPFSEVKQIARSVARYEPEMDVAASSGIGSDAAEAILAAAKAETAGYFFTRATSFLGQPAPIRWIVRGWIPDDGSVSMIYGESASGKTFISLDMACSIAAGLQWQGRKTKPGVVVFLAGEGNYGIRQRVAAWCKAHNIDRLDNLLISNKAIDLDTPGASEEVIRAVRELTASEPVAFVQIDTVNNHMGGDENSAKDTRNMLTACQLVSRALMASVCLTHHTGHGLDTKSRARGSSAWKASLDAAILVTKNEEGLIEITCTKMKDAEPPEPILGRLQSVPLGWIDEDGEEISGAVFMIDENAVADKPKKQTGLQSDIEKIIKAWWASGAEECDGAPYISRSALLHFLTTNTRLSENTAKAYVQESRKGQMVYNLLNAKIITSHSHGWVISDSGTAAGLMLSKGKK